MSRTPERAEVWKYIVKLSGKVNECQDYIINPQSSHKLAGSGQMSLCVCWSNCWAAAFTFQVSLVLCMTGVTSEIADLACVMLEMNWHLKTPLSDHTHTKTHTH